MRNLILKNKRKIIVLLILACSFISYQEDSLANTVTVESNTKIKDSQINVQEYQGNIYEKYDLVPIESLKLTSYLPEILTDYEKFVNRSKELEEIEQAFAGNQVVVITGRGGMGKSSLAIEYGKYFKGDNKIARYINSDATSKIDQTYQGLAKEFDINITGQSPSMGMKLVYNKLSGLPQEILFIFDNVQQYDDIKNYVINLPANTKAIITTRQPRSIPDAPHIALEEFNDEAAMEYLEYSLQNRLPNKKDIQEIINNTSALPYDLKCNLAYLLDNPLTDSKKAILESGGKIKGKLFEEFVTSPDEIKQQAWQILQYAAHLDPDFISMELIKELFLGQSEQTSKAIKKLESLSLISVIADQNGKLGFRIHRKLQKSILYSVKNHQKYSIDNKHLMANLLNVLDKLFPVVDRNLGIDWQVANNLEPHVKKILDSDCKISTRNAKVNQASLYYKLSHYYLEINIDLKRALNYAEESLNKMRNIYPSNHANIANSLHNTGIIYQELGDMNRSLEYLEKSLNMKKALYLGNHPDMAASLHEIGRVCCILGNIEKGLEYEKLGLKMRQELYPTNHPDVAISLQSVGYAYHESGNVEKGLEYQQIVLKMRQELYVGNHPDIAQSLNNIAYSYYTLGNYTNALESITKSVDMYKALYPDDHPRVVGALHTLGALLIQADSPKDGISVLYQALNMAKKFDVDEHYHFAFILYDLGRGYLKLNDHTKALEYAEKALQMRQKLYATTKNHPEIATSLHSLGDIYFASGDKTKALEFYKQALEMSLALSLNHLPETKEIQWKIKKLKTNEMR